MAIVDLSINTTIESNVSIGMWMPIQNGVNTMGNRYNGLPEEIENLKKEGE